VTDREGAGATPDPGDIWARPLWTPGGGDPFVYFVVFGADADLLEIDGDEHRVDEVPDGIDAHEMGPDWVQSFFEPPIGAELRRSDPDTAAEAEASESCIIVTGSVADAPTLDYLRNAIGITTAALDTGAVGVLSLQTFDLFDPERWRDEVFEADRTLAHRLVTVLLSEEDAGTDGQWVHTRGLRVFGRPDLSVRGVTPDQLETTNQLIGALVAQLARGLVIDDGMTMDVGSDVGTLTFDRRGDLDDPDFNNEHLAITWG
jgi:hypothetical protein